MVSHSHLYPRAGTGWSPREAAQAHPSGVRLTSLQGKQVGFNIPMLQVGDEAQGGDQYLTVLFARPGTCWSTDQVKSLDPEAGESRTKLNQPGCQEPCHRTQGPLRHQGEFKAQDPLRCDSNWEMRGFSGSLFLRQPAEVGMEILTALAPGAPGQNRPGLPLSGHRATLHDFWKQKVQMV